MESRLDSLKNVLQEELQCSVCLYVKEDAGLCLTCGNLLCKDCSTRVNKCPQCNTDPYASKDIDRILKNILKRYQSLIEDSEIQFDLISCLLKGCQSKVKRQDL